MSQSGSLASSTISIPGNVPESFVTNSGTATPSGNILNVIGTNGVTTNGSGNTVSIINNIVQAMVSTTIDMKAVGQTVIFTVPAGLKFVPFAVSASIVSNTAAVGNNTYSIGFTAPNYQDFVASSGLSGDTAGKVDQITASYSSTTPAPALSNVVVNVTSADTGTAFTVKFIVIGYFF